METKRPVDILREGGGKADIGTSEDGAIVDTIKINERVYLIKEKAVYEFILADDIDPKRENPNLPLSTHRLIVNLGTHSDIFCRTFLTAKTLFKSEFLSSSIKTDELMLLSIEFIQELGILIEEINDYIDKENASNENYEDRKLKKLDHSIPSIPELKTICKTIFQKADQALQSLMDIVKIFYPEFNKNSYYKTFLDFIKNKLGADDPFTKFLDDTIYFIMLVRNIRNCLDHRRTEIIISNYELQVDANILSPTIEIDHLESKLNRTSLSEFLKLVHPNLTTIFENTIAFLCLNHNNPNKMLPSTVREIPVDDRRYKFVRYAFWSPLGPGGYFHQ